MFKKILLYILTMTVMLVPVLNASADESYRVSSLMGVSIDMNNPDKEVTRGELAQLAVAFTRSTLIEQGKAVFIDIPQKHKMFSVINTVYLNGLMTGYSDGTFRADASASVGDAVRMFLNIVGYEPLLKLGAQSQLISDGDCMSMAKKIGILKDVTSGVLTNAKMNRMIENLSDVKMVIASGGDDTGIEYRETDKTYLNKLGYTSDSGIVGAVGGASLYGYNTTKQQYAVIGDREYKFEGIDMSYYLGCNVKVILDEDKSNILGVSLEKQPECVEIAAKDIESFNNYTYEYSVSKTRTKTISIEADTRVVFNDVNMEYDENMMLPNEGRLRFVDTDNNGSYDLLVIYSAVIFKVGAFSEGEILTDEITNTKLNIKNADLMCINNGAAVGLENISKGMYIRVMPNKMEYRTVNGAVIFSPNAAAENIRIEIISHQKAEGELQSAESDSVWLFMTDKSNNQVKQEYEYSLYIKKLIEAGITDAPVLGGKAVFYLDESGDIIDMEFSSQYTRANGLKYGYLVSMSSGEDGDETVIVIINESAQREVLYMDSKFILNGTKTTVDIQKSLGSSLTNTKLFNSDGTVKKQLICYRTNDEGKPSCIYCAKDYANEYILASDGSNLEYSNPDYMLTGYKGYDNNNFSLDYSSGNGSVLFRNGLNHLYSFNSNTVSFVVPTDPDKYSNYKVMIENGKNAFTYDNSYAIRAYNVDDEYTIGVIVIDNSVSKSLVKRDFNSPSHGGGAQATVITDIGKVWDDESGELRKKTTGTYFNYSTLGTTGQIQQEELICDDTELQDTDTVVHGGKKPFGNLTWDEIEEGDVILYRKDNDGYVNAFVIMNKRSEIYDDYGNPVLWKGQDSLEATIGVTLSRVVNVNSDGSIIFCYGEEGDYTKYFKGTTNDILLYDMKKNSYEVITSADLRAGDIAFTRSWTGCLREVVVYR